MRSRQFGLSLVAAALVATTLTAQTVITPPKNKYSPKDDVQLGVEASQQVEQQMPILRDDRVTSYVEDIGRRLVDGIPPELRHPEFRYTFKVVNIREINAFALPGGPMYLNRGMLEKAKTEGEVAGVMAHEMSHVALRHGTAQATKATPYAIGQIAGAVLGAIVGGTKGDIISQGTQFGLGTAFLRYSREYEKQADILGSQMMARVGYDPRDMANMFKTIEQEGGSGGPQWMSDHPNPGNRQAYIAKEAESLRVQNAVRDTRGFQDVQARLRQMSPAMSSEEVARNAERRGTSGRNVPAPAGRAEAPSSRFQTYNEGDVFKVSVPSNWREMAGNSTVTFAPEGGYGTINNQSVFTHGVETGIARNETHDLQTSTNELIQSLGRSNPRLRQSSNFERGAIGGREALRATLTNVSEATGREERIQLYTTQLRDGSLFYVVGVAPSEEFRTYEPVFRRVVSSIQFNR
jgi:Zn-dependent protease with chaperone function